MHVDPVLRGVIQDIGRQFHWTEIAYQSAATFERLAAVARESTAHWTKHAEALEQLRRMMRRPSKGWRRHVRRVKAGR